MALVLFLYFPLAVIAWRSFVWLCCRATEFCCCRQSAGWSVRLILRPAIKRFRLWWRQNLLKPDRCCFICRCLDAASRQKKNSSVRSLFSAPAIVFNCVRIKNSIRSTCSDLGLVLLSYCRAWESFWISEGTKGGWWCLGGGDSQCCRRCWTDHIQPLHTVPVSKRSLNNRDLKTWDHSCFQVALTPTAASDTLSDFGLWSDGLCLVRSAFKGHTHFRVPSNHRDGLDPSPYFLVASLLLFLVTALLLANCRTFCRYIWIVVIF